MSKLWDWVSEQFAAALVRGWELAQERITGRLEKPAAPALTNGKKETVKR